MCGQDIAEPNESVSAAYALPADQSVLGLVCQSDREFFALTTTPGVSHRVNVAFPHSLSDMSVIVYEDGVLLGTANSSTDHEIAQFTPAAGKSYVAEVVNPSGAETFYQLSVIDDWDCLREDAFAPNHDINNAKLLPYSWLTDAYMCSNSEDWYYLGDLPLGSPVNIDVLFTTGFLDYGNLDLILYGDDNGDNTFDVVASSDDWGDDELLRFTTTFAGRYYLRILPTYPGEPNDYRIGWMNQ